METQSQLSLAVEQGLHHRMPNVHLVADVMTKEVVTVDAERKLHHIEQMLTQHGFHHLLVEDAGRVIGVISDRDVLSAVSPFLHTESVDYRDVRTMHLRAAEIMTLDPICVLPTTAVAQAATLLLRHTISCLPVTDEQRMIQGIVTWKDLLAFYAQPPHSR